MVIATSSCDVAVPRQSGSLFFGLSTHCCMHTTLFICPRGACLQQLLPCLGEGGKASKYKEGSGKPFHGPLQHTILPTIEQQDTGILVDTYVNNIDSPTTNSSVSFCVVPRAAYPDVNSVEKLNYRTFLATSSGISYNTCFPQGLSKRYIQQIENT